MSTKKTPEKIRWRNSYTLIFIVNFAYIMFFYLLMQFYN